MQYLENGMIIVDDLTELKRIVQEKEIPLELINIKESGLTSLDNVFYDIYEINGSIENWDVSNISRMNYTFYNSNINCNLSKWDTSSILHMTNMFAFSKFNNDSLKNWNTSKVINMNNCFANSEFNGDISKWDVSKVKNMSYMFFCSMFKNNSIKDWNVFNVNDIQSIFENCPFNGDISNWRFNPIIRGNNVFKRNIKFKNKYNDGHDIPNEIESFLEWFENNREKMKEINTEEILNFFHFDNLDKELEK